MTVTPFTAFRFEVVLDLEDSLPGIDSPLCDAAFADCEGLEMTMEPQTVDSGGVNDRQIHLIGPVKFAPLTLKRGMTSNLQLWTWLTAVAQGAVAPASGTVTMWDTDGTPVIEFALEGCLPTRMKAPALNAREGQIAIEELSLVYETLSVSLPGSGGLGTGIGLDVSASVGLSVGAGASAGVSVSGGISL